MKRGPKPHVPLGFMVRPLRRWSADGKKLYYIRQAEVFEVDVELRALGTTEFFPSFDVTADGQRFLTVVSGPSATVQRVVVITGFDPRN